MGEAYVKTVQQYFPDFCDQVTRGYDTGGAFEIKTPNIISNPIKWVDIINGEKNPRWRDQVRRGVDATTSMTAAKHRVSAKRFALSIIVQHVTSSYPNNWYERRWDGYPSYGLPSLVAVPSDVLSRARNLAIRKFLAHAEAVRTSVEGGQLLGEWKETVQAITNPLGALRRFTINHVLGAKKRLGRYKRLRGFLNGDGRRPGSGKRPRHPAGEVPGAAAKALADTYLEFVFGWIPLVKDINAAVVGLLDRYDQPDRVIIKGHQLIQYEYSTTMEHVTTYSNVSVDRTLQTFSEIDYRFRASIKTGAVNGVRSVSNTLGLIPSRFLPTFWELIPYSFVVDYFVNVGDIIASYAFQRSSIEWGARTVRQRSVNKYGDPVCRLEDPYPYALFRPIRMGATGGGATVENYTVSRVPIYIDNLMPDLDIHLPYSQKAWYNIGAILTQKFCSL